MCTCNQTFTGSASDLFDKIKTEIQNQGGTINGDAASGDFSVHTPVGTVAGSFTIAAPDLKVEITKKPALVPCSTICNYLRDHLG